MKRSISVPLIFLGTLGGLTYCHQRCDIPAYTDVQVKQDQYDKLNDCQRDWGTEPQNCQETPPNSSPTAGLSGGAHTYSGPRYFWYRHENGGYPMAIDPDGTTRPVKGSHIDASGAKVARQTISSQKSLPTHMTASTGVLRNGFGRIGCDSSSGGS